MRRVELSGVDGAAVRVKLEKLRDGLVADYTRQRDVLMEELLPQVPMPGRKARALDTRGSISTRPCQ